MLEVERNTPVETDALVELFQRCGWQEPDAGAKLEWALAASTDWVVCRLDGELVGFGRSCRLDVVKRVVFDVVVDPRFSESGLRGEIVRLLAQSAGRLEEVMVFSERRPRRPMFPPPMVEQPGAGGIPVAPPGAYLGKKKA